MVGVYEREMSTGALKLQVRLSNNVNGLASNYVVSRIFLRPRSVHQLRRGRFHSLSIKSSSQSEPSIATEFTSSVGSSSPVSIHLNITSRHLLLLNLIACSVAVSATWLFFSAIPALLAFKRAAESLEKLLDVTREELPDTMAAVRLSGMEISDLTMELSDLGQEITQGVKSSTRAVRVAEEKLRQFSNMGSSATMQVVARPRTEVEVPPVARAARNVKEGIVKGRAMLQMFFALTRYSKTILNYFASRGKQ